MTAFVKHILFILIAGLLMTTPEYVYAQKKTQTQTKTQTKTAAKTTAKPAAKPATKPAAKTQTKNQPKTQQKKTQTRTKTLSRAEYEKQQKDLQKRIQATEKMISDNDKSVKTQSRDIKLREQEIGHRRALLVAMHKEIDAIAIEEDSLKNRIVDLQKNFEAKKQKYGQAMRHMYKTRSGLEEVTFILSANTMLESLRRMRYLRQYSDWRKKEALELDAQRIETENTKNELTKTREERENVLKSIDNERAALTRKQEQQEAALADLKKRGQELQAELAKDQKKQAEIERMIQKMIDEERRKTTASAGKSSGSKTTGTSASSASTALTGNFRSNKGRLPYPVDSNFAFLRHYKEKNDGNVSISLSTAVGASAISVFEGTVLRCSRSSDDYTVIISHGDYMSVYSNLSSVSVKEGQAVKTRQSIGKVKTDVDGKRGELMFWIYGKSDAENPESWLRR